MIDYYYKIVQLTDKWHEIKKGKLSASNIYKIITPTLKPAKNETVRQYAYEIAAQQLYPEIPISNFQSYDMARGTWEEDIARDYYNDNYNQVKSCGFVERKIGNYILGYSPDGLVGDDGLIEIKSRLSKFQFQTIINDEVPSEYILQCQTALFVTGRQWLDFIQYSNGLELFVKAVYPDEKYQVAIQEAVINFYQLVDQAKIAYQEKAKQLIKTKINNYEGEINA